MKLIAVLFLVGSAFAEKPCIIAHQHQYKFGENLARWRTHKSLDFVEGSYPSGFKFRTELDEKLVGKINDAKGKVVIIKSGYSQAELDDARNQCKEFQESK